MPDIEPTPPWQTAAGAWVPPHPALKQPGEIPFFMVGDPHVLPAPGEIPFMVGDPALPKIGDFIAPKMVSSEKSKVYAALPFGTVIRGAYDGSPVCQKMPGAPNPDYPWLRFKAFGDFPHWYGDANHSSYRVAAYLDDPFKLFSAPGVSPKATLEWLVKEHHSFALSMAAANSFGKPQPAGYVWRSDEYVIRHNVTVLSKNPAIHPLFVHWDGVPIVYRDGGDGDSWLATGWERWPFVAALQITRIARLDASGELAGFEDICYG